jgi:outer membrane protein insertion porin family
LRGSVELTRRNLGGLGRSAAFFARGSLRGSRLLANLREPWLFGRRLDLLATASWEEEDRGSFSYNRKLASLQAARPLDSRTSLILRYSLQDVAVFGLERPLDEIDRQYRTYALAGPAASLLFDSRDDALEPRRGLFLGADLQLSLASLGGESFVRSYFQATGVRELHRKVVFVVSGRLGLAEGLEPEARDLPTPERFFAGGDFGPRGFAIDGVGPWALSAQGARAALGGNALLLGGAELRCNLTRSFQLASFLDVGNVYALLGEIDLGDLRRSTGLGLRYRTPVGPVRLDWGFVLDRRPGERSSRLHLTIGHAF